MAGCSTSNARTPSPHIAATADYYGTLEPFARDAVYFVLTDRFVNGDPANDQRDQGKSKGPAFFTFDRPVPGAPAGKHANVGYLGGDFKGIVDNADYIRDMGFGAVWVTPIVDNPDEAFTGGDPVKWGGSFTDRGKTGFHGYWGDNFYVLDEHLPSPGLDFRGFTSAMRGHGLDIVLDIVCNHGSPAYTMPKDQPKFGKIYDANWTLLADHQDLPPAKLDPTHNPLHAWYNTGGGLAQLSDINENNPAVLEYFVGAYSQWIDQGAAAFRIDTIPWMPHAYWHSFVQRIRAKHPGFFMFGEAFDYDAKKIAEHTWPQNAGVSVLDFPLKKAIATTFETPGSDYAALVEPLHLIGGPYANPYELMTFYDNHDMARMNASDNGFIDAHNWLFTARGIPVIYYGSEIAFERGAAEHSGNRNYFGTEGIQVAKSHPIHAALARIARVRQASPALQRGLQLNLELHGDRAAFYRVYQHDGVHQVALVLLNKGDASQHFNVSDKLQPGQWRSAFDDRQMTVGSGGALEADVPAHGVQVFLLDTPVTDPGLRRALDTAMAGARRTR
ncbi:alpha-amylase family glycosyl hydrolase [Thermomonas sp.]|uniref:alpha-amylase family glycosyl hydrolase n=1 Tax=Thermomonas sp. TaxID=1971895 RepID=UPI00248A785E|nr:alpha-amylase family glycosyl hydrolase [Thermomonas sp.]MDI1253710.1 alpha-amylase family glycosyl hydrolase [Thermomonas sp.]